MIELLHIDCMEYMAVQPDAAFDLGVKQKNGKVLQCLDGGYTAKGWDKEPPTPEYFAELRRVARHQIIWGANYMPVNLLLESS